MRTDVIIRLFCMADDALGPVKRHPQAKLHRSEIMTIGLVFALRDGRYRAFYRWLAANWADLFGGLPEQSRLFRLLCQVAGETDRFLASPTVLSVIDAFGIELLHPIREGHSPNQLGRKGKSNHIVGIKLAWLANQYGEVVEWQWLPANVSDQDFRDVVDWQDEQTVVLADSGFRLVAAEDDGLPINICPRGIWNERFVIETAFSLLTRVFR